MGSKRLRSLVHLLVNLPCSQQLRTGSTNPKPLGTWPRSASTAPNLALGPNICSGIEEEKLKSLDSGLIPAAANQTVYLADDILPRMPRMPSPLAFHMPAAPANHT
jgi:hypothetical protein